MDRIRIVALLGVVLAGACASQPRLSGAWVGWEGQDRTMLSFRADGRGRRLSSEGVEEFRYAIDYSRDPVAIDLEPAGAEERAGKVLGIVRFDPEGYVQVKFGRRGGPRPTAFTRDAPGLMLRRSASR
jgi:hypothetical protein